MGKLQSSGRSHPPEHRTGEEAQGPSFLNTWSRTRWCTLSSPRTANVSSQFSESTTRRGATHAPNSMSCLWRPRYGTGPGNESRDSRQGLASARSIPRRGTPRPDELEAFRSLPRIRPQSRHRPRALVSSSPMRSDSVIQAGGRLADQEIEMPHNGWGGPRPRSGRRALAKEHTIVLRDTQPWRIPELEAGDLSPWT